MDLYLLRHGLAAKPAATHLHTDRQRPLTAEGVKKVKRVAAAVRAMDLSFDLILSSPFLRARQTAEIVADALKAEKRLQFTELLAASANPKALAEHLAHLRPDRRSVLLVGHEPLLTSLLSLLLSGGPFLRVDLKKAGLCKLSVESFKPEYRAALNWLLTPKQMAIMG